MIAPNELRLRPRKPRIQAQTRTVPVQGPLKSPRQAGTQASTWAVLLRTSARAQRRRTFTWMATGLWNQYEVVFTGSSVPNSKVNECSSCGIAL